jgi:hypothetical protein
MMTGMRSIVTSALAFASFASFALAQPAEPPANPPPVIVAPVEQAVPPKPGLPTPAETIGAIGRFIDRSIANLSAGVRGAGDTLGGATGAAGDIAKGVGQAAGAVARLPLTNVVSGFERCALASNGAPDCETASLALCKSKGYAAGKSVDITSSSKCPAAVWLEGRQPTDAECKSEAFVSRAICQ